MNFNWWNKIAVTIGSLSIVIGVVYSYYEESVVFGTKEVEAIGTTNNQQNGVLNLIIKEQENLERLGRKYLQLNSEADFINFNINFNKDFYYEYEVKVIKNLAYIAVAKPKKKYLKERSIKPEIFYVLKKRDEKVIKSWR